MNTQALARKLVAIFSADVKGYSRLMGQDEAATVKTLGTYREVMAALIKQQRGRVVDSPGDNVLAEFASVVDAVQCAVALQKELKARNAELPENRRMEFRIGINLGDVIEEGDRIYGDGVNITARLEALADPGGICISKTAFDQIETKLPLGYEYLGEQTVKNIAKPVGAYRVLMEPRVTVAGKKEKEKAMPVWRRKAILAGGVSVLLVVITLAIWNFYLRPPVPSVEVASVEKMAFPLPDKPSIAVLPFDNLSADKSHDVLVDGMTEDIIAALARFDQLFVIARNSTFTYKGKPVKVQQVAEELGVRYVLEGSVQISGNRIRVTAQLIDATTGRHVWVERFDRSLKDAFDVQDQVTRKLVSSLAGKLDQATTAMALLKHPDSLDAYGLFLRGQELSGHFTPDDNAKGRGLLEKAISLDPNYASAYAILAWTYFADWQWKWYGSATPKEVYKNALDLAHKAVALDPRNARARWVLGYILLYGNKHDQAVAQFEEGLKANPNYADLLVALADAYVLNGQPKEGIKRVKEAMRLNPYYTGWYSWVLGFAQYVARDYEGAIETITKMSPMGEARRIVAACLAYLGRMDEARAEAERFLKDNPSFSASYWGTTQAFRNEEDRLHTVQGYIKAGLPE
ncbi:MAG: adenylate/guanylate cyclase domain-containing protein [Candidatus Hodarchaeota archaeon]